MMRLVRFGILTMAAVGLFAPAFAVCDRVPAEVIRALGTARGKSISTGLVFIDGKYLRPPYRVTRSGNQILVNDRAVTGPLVPWEKFLDTQPPSNLTTREVEEPETAPSAAPAEDGIDPAAPKDGGNAPPPDGSKSGRPAPRSDGDAEPSLDDLFSQTRVTIDDRTYGAGVSDAEAARRRNEPDKMSLSDIPPDSDEDKARQKRAEEEKKAEEEEEREEASREDAPAPSEAADDKPGEDEEELDPASPEGEAAAKAKAAREAAKPVPRPGYRLRKVRALAGKFDLNSQSRRLLKPIDAYRAKLETTLRRGGYLFFGTGARKYCTGRSSDAITTREVLKRLPELMSSAQDSESFCDAVRSAGLMSYLTLTIAQDLYRNKTDYYVLQQRRREIVGDGKTRKRTTYGR